MYIFIINLLSNPGHSLSHLKIYIIETILIVGSPCHRPRSTLECWFEKKFSKLMQVKCSLRWHEEQNLLWSDRRLTKSVAEDFWDNETLKFDP